MRCTVRLALLVLCVGLVSSCARVDGRQLVVNSYGTDSRILSFDIKCPEEEEGDVKSTNVKDYVAEYDRRVFSRTIQMPRNTIDISSDKSQLRQKVTSQETFEAEELQPLVKLWGVPWTGSSAVITKPFGWEIGNTESTCMTIANTENLLAIDNGVVIENSSNRVVISYGPEETSPIAISQQLKDDILSLISWTSGVLDRDKMEVYNRVMGMPEVLDVIKFVEDEFITEAVVSYYCTVLDSVPEILDPGRWTVGGVLMLADILNTAPDGISGKGSRKPPPLSNELYDSVKVRYFLENGNSWWNYLSTAYPENPAYNWSSRHQNIIEYIETYGIETGLFLPTKEEIINAGANVLSIPVMRHLAKIIVLNECGGDLDNLTDEKYKTVNKNDNGRYAWGIMQHNGHSSVETWNKVLSILDNGTVKSITNIPSKVNISYDILSGELSDSLLVGNKIIQGDVIAKNTALVNITAQYSDIYDPIDFMRDVLGLEYVEDWTKLYETSISVDSVLLSMYDSSNASIK